MSERVLPPVRRPFRAVARVVVPESADLDALGWEQLESIVETALLERPRSVRRQLRLFVRVVQVLPILRYGKPFTRLTADRASDYLRGLERSRLLLFRRGFWGLRTLIFMGYYGQGAVRERVGYRANAGGWDAWRARQAGGAE